MNICIYTHTHIYIYILVFTKYPANVVLWVWLAVLCVRSANLMPLRYHTPVTQVVIDKISTWILWEWWCKWIKQATKRYVEYQLYNAKYYPSRRVVIIIFHFHALLVKGMEISKPITLTRIIPSISPLNELNCVLDKAVYRLSVFRIRFSGFGPGPSLPTKTYTTLVPKLG